MNTSFHGDNAYGNRYLPDDVTIIQNANSAAYIAEHFEPDKVFMILNFCEGSRIEEVVSTDENVLVGEGGNLSVELSSVSVDIADYGFAQTGGDLFVLVSSTNILWTGNAIVAQAPAVPQLLDVHLIETRDTFQKVYDAFDDNTQVVPGHGPVTDIAAIKWVVDYLAAIRTEVSAAIAEGLSVDDPAARVQLPDYQGYALFGWVHPGMSVPAANSDLK